MPIISLDSLQPHQLPRIVLLGTAGTGKTTLAARISEMLGHPAICLDSIWQADWDERNVPEFREEMQRLHAGETWVSDGNYAAATFDIRLPRATLILWLERPKVSSAWRAVRRAFRRGEPHGVRGLAKVFAFIWRFDRINRPRIESHIAQHGPHVPVLRLYGDRDVEEFLAFALVSAEPVDIKVGGHQQLR